MFFYGSMVSYTFLWHTFEFSSGSNLKGRIRFLRNLYKRELPEKYDKFVKFRKKTDFKAHSHTSKRM